MFGVCVIVNLTNESFSFFPTFRGLGEEVSSVVVGSAVSVSVVETVYGNDDVVESLVSWVVDSDCRGS